VIVLSYDRYCGYNALYARRAQINERACKSMRARVYRYVYKPYFIPCIIHSYVCTHADAQTSTASESFRCDVCRQRRAFFNEKATTRVYVTRQKLLDFSCFGGLGNIAGKIVNGSLPVVYSRFQHRIIAVTRSEIADRNEIFC